MKITVTTSHTVLFKVESFWNEEGGMGSDQYGTSYDTIEKAIQALQEARARCAGDKYADLWLITCYVETVTK